MAGHLVRGCCYLFLVKAFFGIFLTSASFRRLLSQKMLTGLAQLNFAHGHEPFPRILLFGGVELQALAALQLPQLVAQLLRQEPEPEW